MTAYEVLRLQFEKKKKVHGYSLRALARDLGVSAPFLSNVLKGKKRLPKKLIEPVIRILDIDHETALLLKQESPSWSETRGYGTVKWIPSEKKSLSILRHWYYVPIMDLTSCSNFDGRVETIAQRLSLSVAVVEVALRELLAAGLLEAKDGRITKATRLMRLASSNSMDDIRTFHRQMLKKAQDELTKTSTEDLHQRLISGITVTASPETIEKAKQMLHESLHEIAQFLCEGEGTEVYHLAVQLFPLTQKSSVVQKK